MQHTISEVFEIISSYPLLHANHTELTQRLIIVHTAPNTAGSNGKIETKAAGKGAVASVASPRSEAMEEVVSILDEVYPKLRIDLVTMEGIQFNPTFVEFISQTLNIRKNRMFLMCPDSRFQHSLKDFGGVRIISGGASAADLVDEDNE